MLEKIFAPVLRFFAILGSALTGMTAVFTAVGFLAERSHLMMLGFSTAPVDLNQYLYTGARFIAFLPILSLSAIGLGALDVARKFAAQFFIVLALFLLVSLVMKFPLMQDFKAWIAGGIRKLIAGLRSYLLFFIVIFQFVCIFQLIRATQLTNLLFLHAAPKIDAGFFPVSSDKLAAWILIGDNQMLFKYMGVLFMISLVSAVLLWKVASTIHLADVKKIGFWQKMWLGINLMLIATQIILLPVNYGALLLPNRFATVLVDFKRDASSEIAFPEESELILLHREGGSYYLYSRKKCQIWKIEKDAMLSLRYQGMFDIFQTKNNANSNTFGKQ